MNWKKAPDIKKTMILVCKYCDFPYIDTKRIICFRSFESTSRARARIWSFPKIWQDALQLPAHYVIEVLSEKFDHLSEEDKVKVVIHELLHIPKNFSGSLRPHKARNWRLDHKLVDRYYKEYKEHI